MEPNYRARLISRTRLEIDGFLYVRSCKRKNSTYWNCKKVRAGECKARAVTTVNPLQEIQVRKGPRESLHRHAPNRDAAEAERIVADIKTRAEAPGAKPATILRGI